MDRSLFAQRQRLDYTQADVAKMLDISTGTISNIENGNYSSWRHAYVKLLARLRLERLREEIHEHPVEACEYVVEVLRKRCSDPPARRFMAS